ncbi:MAG: DUF3810 domain-containing protein [Oscillospiraceae bacterium]|nr:DUF3810 domain-containing protein [Oscillospiraceae bacterium]
MKEFILKYKKLHIWLVVAVALLAFFWIGKRSRALMDFVGYNITQPIKTTIGAATSVFPFSLAEIVIYALIILVCVLLARVIAALARRKKRGRLYPRLMTLICAVLTVGAASAMLWGVNYYTDNFKDMSGIRDKPVATDDLYAVTKYFAENLAASSDGVARDDSGLFAVSRSDIIAESPYIYAPVTDEFPYLAMKDHRVKPFYFSHFMSLLDFTGFYFPLTGEANLNVESPACLLPATVAHEMAHQRGFSSEQECNFIAIIVSTRSGYADYEYSGWLFGFIHLNNALYDADRDEWEQLYSTLPADVQADIENNNAYWDSMRGEATEAADKVYDSYLKGYGEESGIQSYGEVVDLLVEYYKDKC